MAGVRTSIRQRMASLMRKRTVYSLLSCTLLIGLVGCAGQEGPGKEVGEAEKDDRRTKLIDAYPDAAQFYQGRKMRFIIPADPGGGYDTYSRLAIPYLENYTGATIVPENRSGAGGLLAANMLFNSAQKDGTVIGMLQGMGAGIAQIAGAEGAKYDLTKFGWIGRVGGLPQVVEVAANSPIDGPEDLVTIPKDTELVLGATGPGSAAYVSLSVLAEVIGFRHRMVTGFGGSGEVRAAMLQGEVDMTTNGMSSAFTSIKAGDTRAVVSLGLEKDKFMQDVPVAHRMKHLDDQGRKVLQTHGKAGAIGRPIVTPPGIPEDRLAFLQEALSLAMTDPELKRDARNANRPLRFATAKEMKRIATEVINSPHRYRELVTDAYRA